MPTRWQFIGAFGPNWCPPCPPRRSATDRERIEYQQRLMAWRFGRADWLRKKERQRFDRNMRVLSYGSVAIVALTAIAAILV